MRTMSRHSSLAVLAMITAVISLLLCLGYFIGGLNAMYVAKALAESDSTSLPDISRRLGNGFFYFKPVATTSRSPIVSCRFRALLSHC